MTEVRPDLLDRLAVTLRPCVADDSAFLEQLYISVRRGEFAQMGWNEAQLGAFLGGQYRLQTHHYATHYPEADLAIVAAADRLAGRLFVHHGGADVRIVDISLMPDWRGQGIGTALLEGVLDAARRVGKTVSLHVELSNPALRLYQRLGFRDTGERHGPYGLMTYPG